MRRSPQDRGRSSVAQSSSTSRRISLWGGVFDEHGAGKIRSLLVPIEQSDPGGRLQRAETKPLGRIATGEEVHELRA
jgi:hypothetical protein